jgi:hypothetical protein
LQTLCPNASIAVGGGYNQSLEGIVLVALSNEGDAAKLSPRDPQGFVDNLLMIFAVGSLQRREIKHWRGLQPACFDYNEVPTSSCHTFCWKARH